MLPVSEYQTVFQKYSEQYHFDKEPASLYAPINHIMSIGGKRMRPVLVLMGCNIYDDSIEKALPASLAVEIFHNFTLVHDDIMDAAPLRRGFLTVHHKYGLSAGILSGDAMVIYAYQFLLQTNVSLPRVQRLLQIFNKMAIEVCEGQMFDMDFETRTTVTEQEYMHMIEFKTSVLVGSALEIGAVIGGAKNAEARILYYFGCHVGIAFQMKDDILDSFGDPKKVGKKVGGDIAQNKKTLLVIKALESGNEQQVTTLKNLLATITTEADESEKIKTVKAIFISTGAKKAVEALQEEHLAEAFSILDKSMMSKQKRQYLKDWTLALMQREN